MYQHLLIIGLFMLICGIIHWAMKKTPGNSINKEIEVKEPIKKAV